MVYEIIWTELASNQFNKVIEYLSAEWSIGIALEFTIEFYERIELLKSQPEIGVESNKYKNIRRILITKQNALYYQVGDDKIILLELFDTRQNPTKNKYD